MAFQVPYIYDYRTKSCRQQAEVIQNLENENVRDIGKDKARHGKCKRLNSAAVKGTIVEMTRQPL
jgi:predicted nucleic acid-binding Zn ribbon protein